MATEEEKEYQRQYYLKNREKVLARQKKANEKRKDQIKEYSRKWEAENREKRNAQSRANYAKAKEQFDMAKENSEVISPTQAAAILNISLRQFREWIYTGKIPATKTPGGRYIIKRSDVDAIIQQCHTKDQNPNAFKTLAMVRKAGQFIVPPGFDLITEYKELTEYTAAFAQSKIGFLLLVGSPGSGKSKQMKRDLYGTGVTWIDNHVTNMALYAAVYNAHGAPCVLDDVNHFLKNKVACSLIKALTQTESKRGVSWESPSAWLEQNDIPRQYTTSSPICLIGNMWEDSDPDYMAIKDRALPVAFYPTAETIHKRVIELGWCDKEVIDFIGEHLCDIQQPSMREYYQGMCYKRAGMDWKKKLLAIWGLE